MYFPFNKRLSLIIIFRFNYEVNVYLLITHDLNLIPVNEINISHSRLRSSSYKLINLLWFSNKFSWSSFGSKVICFYCTKYLWKHLFDVFTSFNLTSVVLVKITNYDVQNSGNVWFSYEYPLHHGHIENTYAISISKGKPCQFECDEVKKGCWWRYM